MTLKSVNVWKKVHIKTKEYGKCLKIDGCMHPLLKIDGCSFTLCTRYYEGPVYVSPAFNLY